MRALEKPMIVLIDEFGGNIVTDDVHESAESKGFVIVNPIPNITAYRVNASLDVLDVVMLAQGFHMTPHEMVDKALDVVLERLMLEQAKQGMMLIYISRYYEYNGHTGIMALVFVHSTDLRSLS